MIKATCPNNPEHNQFITTAHEVHDWIVDENGDFVKDLGCEEVAHRPNKDNNWSCLECGESAILTEI